MKHLILICLTLNLVLSTCKNDSPILNDMLTESSYHSNKLSDNPVSGDFIIPTANMLVPRAAHTATSLIDGTVLVCGGFAGSNSNILASAELYDSPSKTFIEVGNLSSPRFSHTATLLPNGKVLIAGGYNGTSLSTTEIYDPESKTFTMGPNLITARYGHTVTQLDNERLLITGGVGSGWTFLASAEIYDIQAGKFIQVNAMAVAREAHTATLLENGNVLITGGHRDRRENIKIYTDSEIFDSKSNKFYPTGSMNIPRHKHDAVLLSDGKVLINGGADKRDSVYSSAEIYDPLSSQFTSISNMNYPRYKHKETSILLSDNSVLIGGGSDKAEIYDVSTAKFHTLEGNLGKTRMFSSATLMNNGEILITGGYDEMIAPISQSRLIVLPN